MADVSKNKQAVSNQNTTENVPECSLIPPDKNCDILPVELNEDSDLLDEGSSLQELIDSELALRVSGTMNYPVDDESDEKVDQIVANRSDDYNDDLDHRDDIDSCLPNFGGLDINTQLIMAERKSCFENMSVNGTHFFTVIDEPLEDPDPDLLLEGPSSDNAGETSVVYDSTTVDMNGIGNESHNYETLMNSTDISCENQQLNLSPVDSEVIFPENDKDIDPDSIIDSSLVCDPNFVNDDSLLSSPNENITDNSSTVKDDSSVIQCGKEPVVYDFFSSLPEDADLDFDSSTLEYPCQEQGEELLVNISGDVTTVDDVENGGFIDTAISESEINDKCAVEEDIIQSSYPQPAVNGDSIINKISAELESLAISEQSITDVGGLSEEGTHLNGLTEDPVHGIVDDVAVCTNLSDNSTSSSCSELDSKEMVTANATEKKIVKKKKKTEGGETVKTKKTKKSKKADYEKENFSVIGMECETITTITDNNDLSTLNGENQENLQDDDLLNVSVKELKKTYNSEATKGFNKKACNGTEEIMTGISIEQLKSSFSKFDQLSKKTVLHVRSVDASKVQQQFNQNAATAVEVTNNCRSCSKQVFQMEQVKAEGAVWHKNCFRCKECNKQLNVDSYSSNEGVLYCMPHFKELFKPKAVPEDENEMPRLRRPKMIICENQPVELPPEVVRASDKPDLGLEELSALNVKSRYQLFEKTESDTNSVERSPSSVSVKRSPSILSKLARFQAKGMDIGVTDESLSNVPYEESSSSSEEEEEEENEEEGKDVIRANRKQRERPVSFNKMGDIKCKWETGHATKKEERREERKQEIQSIRSRLFMGKQGKMKEMYEQAVQDSERSAQKKDLEIRSEKAKSLKEKFERGEVFPDDDEENDAATKQDQHRKSKEEDLSIFEEGISKKSRSLFLELDAKTQQPPLLMSPVKSPQIKDDSKKATLTPQISKDIVRASDAVEDVKVETSEVFSKFKFFETYKEPEREKKQFRITPPREGQVKEGSPENTIYRDPSVVRSEDKVEDEIVKAKTASKMLSIFRQMEENATKEELPEGPKPLKRFTPPPDYTKESEDSEEEEDSDEEEEEDEEDEEEETNPNIVRASDKIEDEFLKQAATAARAKALRAKFERWEEKENKLNKASSGCNLDVDQTDQPSIDSTKSLRAKFESLKNEANQHKERAQPKVNRFVEFQTSSTPLCSTCSDKVYPLEKVEAGGKLFHKQCFRCQHCNCILRMESYTFNNDKLYCIPHFKQLFIAKGNYDEGFGIDQHKRKWNISPPSNDIFKQEE